jgi:hypothetical protein
MDQLPATNTDNEVTYCARHPNVETYLRCGRCDTPICPRCLVQTPVGARCPECANISRLPTFDVPLAYFIRGLVAAAAGGFGLGIVWGYISGGGRGLGFFTFFLAMGLGWAVSEVISLATNRKRGVSLQICAVAGVLIAFLVRNIVLYGDLLPRNDPFVYIAAGFAAFFASSRLKF